MTKPSGIIGSSWTGNQLKAPDAGSNWPQTAKEKAAGVILPKAVAWLREWARAESWEALAASNINVSCRRLPGRAILLGQLVLASLRQGEPQTPSVCTPRAVPGQGRREDHWGLLLGSVASDACMVSNTLHLETEHVIDSFCLWYYEQSIALRFRASKAVG